MTDFMDPVGAPADASVINRLRDIPRSVRFALHRLLKLKY